MADLTRFDFQALRFLKSESVAEMSLEEVGQYVFLLCEAWLGGKGATLPDNFTALARLARCNPVSKKVLEMFPVVETEWGPRRRNETLYGEWVAVQTRLTTASIEGKRGNEIRWGATREPIGTPSGIGTAPGRVDVARTIPYQTIPNQYTPAANFKSMRLRYFQAFGVHHSNCKKAVEKYYNICDTFGEEFVLKKFDEWAPQNKWVKDRNDSGFGLNFFYPTLEISKAAEEQAKPEQDDAEEFKRQAEESIRSQSELELAAEAEREAERKFAEEHRDEI